MINFAEIDQKTVSDIDQKNCFFGQNSNVRNKPNQNVSIPNRLQTTNLKTKINGSATEIRTYQI